VGSARRLAPTILALAAQNGVRSRCLTESWWFLSLGRRADLAAPLAIIFWFGAEGKVPVPAVEIAAFKGGVDLLESLVLGAPFLVGWHVLPMTC
jgi:hypothetical protein